MKNFIVALGLLASLQSFANIEHIPKERKVPTASRIEANRKCFKELELQGCGDPADMVHFRSCMNNAFASLTDNCKALMTKLYGRN